MHFQIERACQAPRIMNEERLDKEKTPGASRERKQVTCKGHFRSSELDTGNSMTLQQSLQKFQEHDF